MDILDSGASVMIRLPDTVTNYRGARRGKLTGVEEQESFQHPQFDIVELEVSHRFQELVSDMFTKATGWG